MSGASACVFALIAVGAVVWVRYYGRTHIGSIRGTAWSCTVAGSGCGPLVMGVIHDHHGGFGPAIAAFFFVMAGLAVTAWWATPPSLFEIGIGISEK